MRLDYVNAINFFNHINTELDLTKVKSPVLISSPNGFGKSSLICESLTFCLFGETRLGNLDDCIRDEEDSMSVTIKFNLSNQNIVITRSKKRSKSQKLKLIIDDVDVSELLSETQKRIDKLIGLSYDTFRSSVLLRQNDSEFFIKAKPDERKAIIAEILNLGQYERLEKIAKDKRSLAKTEIKSNQYILDGMEDLSNIEELRNNLITVNKMLSKYDVKIETAQELLNKIVQYNSTVYEQLKRKKDIEHDNSLIRYQIKQENERIESISKEIGQLQDIISNFKDPTTFLKQAQEIIEDLQQQEEANNRKLKSLELEYDGLIKIRLEQIEEPYLESTRQSATFLSELRSVQQRLDKIYKLNTNSCPTCLRELDKEEVTEMKEELEKQVSILEDNITDIDGSISSLKLEKKNIQNGNFPEAKELSGAIGDLEAEIKDTKSKISQGNTLYKQKIEQQRKYDISKERSENLKQKIIDSQTQIDFITQQIKPVPEVTLELKDDQEAKSTLTKLKSEQKQGLNIQAEITQNIEQTEKNEIKRAKLIEVNTKHKSDLELLELLCVAFSRSGIPSHIISNVLPEIQDDANFYLSKMSDGAFELRFDTVATLKNGNEKNTLDIEVYNGTKWLNFNNLSGGQASRVSFAIRLALSKVLSRRAGVSLDLLILDEPSSGLDSEGIELFASTVKSLTSSFSRIIIMSHIDSIKSEFDNKIDLSKLKRENNVG